MLELSPETRQEIVKLAETMATVFAPPELIPGCEVMSVADKDLYDTENGWIEAVCGRHNQQRCRWKGKFANVQVGDYVDVLFFSSIKLFEVMAKGGTGAISTGGGWPYTKVITVDPTDLNADYATITLALAGAAAGDTILVGAGTYTEHLTISKAVTIKGVGVDKTIITHTDGLTVGTRAVLTFEDLTINNTGNAGGGGGAYNSKQRTVIVNDDGNDNGNVTFINCRIGCVTTNANGSHALEITGGAGANTVRLLNGTEVSTANSNGASTADYGVLVDACTVEIVGGKITGVDYDVNRNAGGTVTLKYPILTNSLIIGTYTGSWLSATGDIRQAITTDTYPADDKRGIGKRVIWGASTGVTDHFQSGVIPTGYAWLAAGNIDGTAAAAANIINYALSNDWMAAYPGAGVKSFLYKSVASDPITKIISAKISCGATGSIGLRLDKNNDTDFYEFYFTEQSTGAVRWSFIYKVGGARTLVSGTIDFPANLDYQIGLYLYDNGANQLGIGYIYANQSGYPSFQTNSPGEAKWGNVTHRSGLVLKTPYGVGLCDVFYNTFA